MSLRPIWEVSAARQIADFISNFDRSGLAHYGLRPFFWLRSRLSNPAGFLRTST